MKLKQTHDLLTAEESTIIQYPAAAPVPTPGDEAERRRSDLGVLLLTPMALVSEVSLEDVTRTYAKSQRSFIDEGIQFVALKARLNSLRQAMDLRPAEMQNGARRAPKRAHRAAGKPLRLSPVISETDATTNAAVSAEKEPKIPNQMQEADRLWRDKETASNGATSLPASRKTGEIARLKTRTRALERLTRSMHRRVLEMQAEIGNLAVELFERDAPAGSDVELCTREVNARLDIAAQLLADGMNQALVMQLARFDADVVLALSSDFD